MKVKTLIKFKDKNTKLWHNVDDEFEVSEERFKEIKNFVEKLKAEKKKNVGKSLE